MQHQTDVRTSVLWAVGSVYQGVCECGWKGDVFADRAQARRDAREHQAVGLSSIKSQIDGVIRSNR